jgi:hypothetical protein
MPTKLQPGSNAQNPQQLSRHQTIAFFSSSPGGSFHYEKWQTWRGIAEAAREAG